MIVQRVTKWLRDLPIKLKVILVGVVTASGGLLVALVALVALTSWQHRTQSKGELERVADLVATYSSAPLLFDDKATAHRTLAGFERDKSIVTAAVYDSDGNVFAVFQRDSEQKMSVPARPRIGYSYSGSDPVLFWPVEMDGEILGTVYLRSNGEELARQINVLTMVVGLVMFICLMVSIVISSKLQQIISDPLLRLTRIAREISATKSYSVRVEQHTNDEIGQLYDAFNGMLVQIQQRDDFLETNVAARTADLSAANEQLTVSKERAEEADRLKSEFLANMSHEIRTPMSIIRGMTELTLQADVTGKQRRNLEIVLSSSESLLKLINELLDLSKIEAGRMELNEGEFDFKKSVGQSLDVLELLAREKQISLQYEIDPRIPTMLIGDIDRLRQVLTNIVGNAIKFTEPDGEIMVRARTDRSTADGTEVHVCVSDTGPGIPRDKQEVIFEAFRQADGSVTRTHGGSGLGLQISKQLVELMGGGESGLRVPLAKPAHSTLRLDFGPGNH